MLEGGEELLQQEHLLATAVQVLFGEVVDKFLNVAVVVVVVNVVVVFLVADEGGHGEVLHSRKQRLTLRQQVFTVHLQQLNLSVLLLFIFFILPPIACNFSCYLQLNFIVFP